MPHAHVLAARPAIVAPISAALLTSGGDPTDRLGSDQGYKTASVALTAGKTYIGFVETRRSSAANQGTLSCTMPGTTWTLIGQTADGQSRMAAFRCQPAANVSAAQITVGNFDPINMDLTIWQFVEITGAVADTGNNGAAAIGAFGAAVGTGDSPNVDVGTVEAANGCVAGVRHYNTTGLTPMNGFAEINDVPLTGGSSVYMASLFAVGIDNPGAMATGVGGWGICGVEVIAA